jgi:hypothetical protein
MLGNLLCSGAETKVAVAEWHELSITSR